MAIGRLFFKAVAFWVPPNFKYEVCKYAIQNELPFLYFTG